MFKEKISVFVRFHDISRIEQLSKVLLSLAHQSYKNVEPVILLQSFSEEQKQKIQYELDLYRWSSDVEPKILNIFNDQHTDLRSVLINEGFNATKDSRYIAILDFDEIARSQFYEALINRLKKSEAAIAFSNHATITYSPFNHFDYTTKIEYIDRSEVVRSHFMRHNLFSMCDFVIDRSRIHEEDILHIPDDLTYEEDYHLFIKIFTKYPMDIGLGKSKNPQIIRRIADDGSNTIVTQHDTKEQRKEKLKLREYGQHTNNVTKKELKKEHDLNHIAIWMNPLKVRENLPYTWVLLRWLALTSKIQDTSEHQNIKLLYPNHYKKYIRNMGNQYKYIEMCPNLIQDLDIYADGETWGEKNINHWISLLKGDDSEVAHIEHQLLDYCWRRHPFDTLVSWSTAGNVSNYCQKHGIDHVSLELGPTRSPFFLSGFCDPFGVNGDSMIHYLPEFTSFIDQCHDLEEQGQQMMAMVHPKEAAAPDLIWDIKQQNKKIALIPMQLDDDTNFLLYCDQFSSMLEFIQHTTKELTSKGWVCLIKPHPGRNSSQYLKDRFDECMEWIEQENNEDIIIFDESLPQRDYLGLLKYVDAVVSINSSLACEASLLGTPYVSLGKSSFAQKSYISLEELTTLSKDEIDHRQRLQYKSSIFSILYLFVPINDLFVSTSLLKRISEAKSYKKSYDFGGSQSLLEKILKRQRSTYFDYLSAGRKMLSGFSQHGGDNAEFFHNPPKRSYLMKALFSSRRRRRLRKMR